MIWSKKKKKKKQKHHKPRLLDYKEGETFLVSSQMTSVIKDQLCFSKKEKKITWFKVFSLGACECFLPQPKHMHLKLAGDSKLTAGVGVRVGYSFYILNP